MAHAIAMVHTEDPKAVVMRECEPYLDSIEVLGSRILVGVYVPPDRTAGGLYLTAKTRDEANPQGKVGLVLKVGAIAFMDDQTHRFGGIKPQIGDWVVFNVGDTFGMELGQRRARAVEDVDVCLIISNPDAVR